MTTTTQTDLQLARREHLAAIEVAKEAYNDAVAQANARFGAALKRGREGRSVQSIADEVGLTRGHVHLLMTSAER